MEDVIVAIATLAWCLGLYMKDTKFFTTMKVMIHALLSCGEINFNKRTCQVMVKVCILLKDLVHLKCRGPKVRCLR